MGKRVERGIERAPVLAVRRRPVAPLVRRLGLAAMIGCNRKLRIPVEDVSDIVTELSRWGCIRSRDEKPELVIHEPIGFERSGQVRTVIEIYLQHARKFAKNSNELVVLRRVDHGDNQRGAELQVRMDLDNDGPFGRPSWGEEDPTSTNVNSGLWSATNVKCPYPDDYNNPFFTTHELRGQYNLTVGEGCRPGPQRAKSSWTHWLTTDGYSDEGGVDSIGLSIDTMHRAKDDHSKKFAGGELKSELDWCNEHSRARGSCRFVDHLPAAGSDRTLSKSGQGHTYPGYMTTPPGDYGNDDGLPITTTALFRR